jgi:hypothetical protein
VHIDDAIKPRLCPGLKPEIRGSRAVTNSSSGLATDVQLWLAGPQSEIGRATCRVQACTVVAPTARRRRVEASRRGRHRFPERPESISARQTNRPRRSRR